MQDSGKIISSFVGMTCRLYKQTWQTVHGLKFIITWHQKTPKPGRKEKKKEQQAQLSWLLDDFYAAAASGIGCHGYSNIHVSKKQQSTLPKKNRNKQILLYFTTRFAFTILDFSIYWRHSIAPHVTTTKECRVCTKLSVWMWALHCLCCRMNKTLNVHIFPRGCSASKLSQRLSLSADIKLHTITSLVVLHHGGCLDPAKLISQQSEEFISVQEEDWCN